MYVRMYVCKYLYIYIYIYTHTRVHTGGVATDQRIVAIHNEVMSHVRVVIFRTQNSYVSPF